MDSTSSMETIDNEPLFERTLVLIKPDGMMYRDAIVKRLKNAGFVTLQVLYIDFYSLHILINL